jgi:RimJ/RimL family protein N-acetyltransferase
LGTPESHNLLSTERISLIRLEGNECDFIVSLMNSPGWLTHIGNRNVHTCAEVKTYVAYHIVPHYSNSVYGMHGIFDNQQQLLVGICGLLQRDYLEYPDLGFALLTKFERKGYALEASKLVLAFAFEQLHVENIAGITVPANIKSITLLERLGMEFVKNIVSQNGEALLHYQIHRDKWLLMN